MSRDDGSITALVAVVTIALILVAGLVLDGGRVLAARRRAQDLAANAARAGAQAIDEDRLRRGDTVLDPEKSRSAIRRYLSAAAASGTAQVSPDIVSVTVSVPVRMLLLSIAGVVDTTVTSTQRARAVQGVTTGE